jgi:ATP-dependent Clp protease adaptor protein ClpS
VIQSVFQSAQHVKKFMPGYEKVQMRVVRVLALGTITESEVESDLVADRPWVCVVWDDPVNLMTYVTHVFMLVFGYSKERATELMLKVHNDGRATVASGTREEMERDVQRLHEYGLWATVQRDDEF